MADFDVVLILITRVIIILCYSCYFWCCVVTFDVLMVYRLFAYWRTILAMLSIGADSHNDIYHGVVKVCEDNLKTVEIMF